MPTYEYLCESCGKRFDHFQQMSDPPLKRCLCCHRGKVKRQFGTGAGIIFKGGGFYCTDYRSENYRKGAKQDHPATSAPAPAKAEATKPAAPAKPKPSSSTGD